MKRTARVAAVVALLLSVSLLLSSRSTHAAPTAEELLTQSRAVLAQLEGQIAIPGLRQPVEVLRDRWGVPHIYAQNQDDLFFAQGFVAAQDRLFQMDMWRRIAVGETAEVLGRESLVRDRMARLLKYRGDMDAEWTSYSADTQRIVTAFTRGINAYIDHIGDRLPIEFQIAGYRPKKWQPADCLGRTALLPVAQNLRHEVARARLVAAIGVEQTLQVMPTDPPVPLTLAPGLDLSGIDQSLLAGYKAITDSIEFAGDGGGSNNWVVDATRSASGKPLLASDPHRSLAVPSLRYLVHLNAPGWNVIGSGEPALPGVAIGHNQRIAWGFTIVMTDQADIIVEQLKPDNPNQYKAGDRWEEVQSIHETVQVKGAEPAVLDLRSTRHGPIIHEDRERHLAYALRWVGTEPGTAAYLGSLAIDRAGNWSDFLAAVKRWKTPSENIVYADVDGNIGWVAAALSPIRKGYNGLLPVPGAGGQYRWDGFLDVHDLPQSLNPADHFLATANHKILPPGYSREIAYDWSAPYRYQRVRQALEAPDRFTLDDFKRIQYDNVSIPGQQLSRLLAGVRDIDPALRPYVEIMSRWDGALTKESAAGAIYGHWLRELTHDFLRWKVPEKLLDEIADRSNISSLLAELHEPSAAWFGDQPSAARDRLLVESFARAVNKTKTMLGDDANLWQWGRVQQVHLKHPLHKLGSAYVEAFNVGPIPTESGPFAPNQARWDKQFSRTHGPSYRHIFDLSDWDQGQATSMPGQSGQPGSPHYADLLPMWDTGEYFPLAYSRPSVEKVTLHRLVLRPAN
jgi:penicillin amidase